MDGFLGTSIQYSEQQIKLLEEEHALNLEKTVEDLIKSGFMDSDYDEDSTDTEYSDTESTEYEELKSNDKITEIESCSEKDEELKLNSNSEALVLVSTISDISAVDEDNESNADIINDTGSNSNGTDSTFCDDDDEREEYYDTDSILLSPTIKHLIEILVSFLIIFMVSFNSNMLQNEFERECQGQQQFVQQTSIHWLLEETSSSTQKSIINEDVDENEETSHRPNMVSFDIMTTINHQKHQIEFKIAPSDLIQCDNDNDNDDSQQIPRLFLQFGAGLKFKSPQMMRIFKETLSETVGRKFARTHGLTALVMSFVGIAAFAASSTAIKE